MKRLPLILIALVCSPCVHAIVDENSNGLSDLWEKTYNGGNLFPGTFLAAADPDADGWTNAQEASAGTDPLNANPPDGHFTPDIEITPATYWDPENDSIPDILTPEVATLTWTTRPGTLYILQYSTTLTPNSWVDVDESYLEENSNGQTDCNITLTQSNGQIAEKLFWRVKVTAADSDEDGLTNAEEYLLGTNPSNAYSDSDLLSDYQEVARYHTDPSNSDSDEDGTPDDADPDIYVQDSANFPGTNSEITYAPVLKWLYASRSVNYRYFENNSNSPSTPPAQAIFSTWSSFKEPFFQEDPNGTSVTPKEYGSLLTTLHNDFPFPSDGVVTSQSVLYRQIFSSSYTTASTRKTEILDHSEAQIKLMATEQVEAETNKQIMVVKWVNVFSDSNYPGGVAPPTVIEAHEFSIPAHARISSPKTFGTDYTPGGTLNFITREFHSPDFRKVGDDEKGWDNTSSELWRGLAKNETTSIRLEGFAEKRKVVLDLLEIVAIEGAGNVTLIGQTLPLTGDVFQVKGISATPETGARIVLRLAAAPHTIFASMRVHVFEKQELPVTIYRIYDSRDPGTEFNSGPSNKEIIAKMNEAYIGQGNIHFYDHGSSSTYDMGYDKSAWPHVALPENKRYFINDCLNGNLLEPVWEMTRKGIHGMPAPAKIIIHVVRNFADSNILGFTVGKDLNNVPLFRGCFVQVAAPVSTYVHEVGHAIGLATRKVGQENSHDHGPLPSSFNTEFPFKTSLMYDYNDETRRMHWTRQEDWWEANDKSKALK
jgi:hypothetical protein